MGCVIRGGVCVCLFVFSSQGSFDNCAQAFFVLFFVEFQRGLCFRVRLQARTHTLIHQHHFCVVQQSVLLIIDCCLLWMQVILSTSYDRGAPTSKIFVEYLSLSGFRGPKIKKKICTFQNSGQFSFELWYESGVLLAKLQVSEIFAGFQIRCLILLVTSCACVCWGGGDFSSPPRFSAFSPSFGLFRAVVSSFEACLRLFGTGAERDITWSNSSLLLYNKRKWPSPHTVITEFNPPVYCSKE